MKKTPNNKINHIKGSSRKSFLLVVIIFVAATASYIYSNFNGLNDFLFSSYNSIQQLYASFKSTPTNYSITPANYSSIQNPYLEKPYSEPENQTTIVINSSAQLISQVQKVNQTGADKITFLIQDGIYTLNKTLVINNDYISFSSISGNPESVIIQGSKYKNTGIEHIFRVSGKHFSIENITLQNVKNHLIQIAGESDADYPVIRNCILQDGYQQLLKVSYDSVNHPELSSDFGLVENNIFKYTDDLGPNYYIGGIDMHAGNSWIIRNNKFQNIASPGKYIAEYAIHIWNNAHNNLVENNLIEDCDRGIGFGMIKKPTTTNVTYSNRGGIIRNNTILHEDNHDPFADAGIVLEDSALTIVENNRIWLGHDYPRAIEYRYSTTTDVIIRNNITNRRISSRDGGLAEVYDNVTDASLETILTEYLVSSNQNL